MPNHTVKKTLNHWFFSFMNPDIEKWFIRIITTAGVGLMLGGGFNIAGKFNLGDKTTGSILIDNQPDYPLTIIGFILFLFAAYFFNRRQSKGDNNDKEHEKLHKEVNKIRPNNGLIQRLFYRIYGFEGLLISDIRFLLNQDTPKGVVSDFKYARNDVLIENNCFIKKDEETDFKKIKDNTGRLYLVVAFISLLVLIAPYVATAFDSPITLNINYFTLTGYIIALLDTCLIPRLRRYSCADRLMNMQVKTVPKSIEIQEYQTITYTAGIES